MQTISEQQEEGFRAAAEELFFRIIQMTNNAGATDEHRAPNYLAVRYPAIYATGAQQYGRNCSLSGVEVHPSRLSGHRSIVDVTFSLANRSSDVTGKHFVQVDVTEELTFLVTKMLSFYEH